MTAGMSVEGWLAVDAWIRQQDFCGFGFVELDWDQDAHDSIVAEVQHLGYLRVGNDFEGLRYHPPDPHINSITRTRVDVDRAIRDQTKRDHARRLRKAEDQRNELREAIQEFEGRARRIKDAGPNLRSLLTKHEWVFARFRAELGPTIYMAVRVWLGWDGGGCYLYFQCAGKEMHLWTADWKLVECPDPMAVVNNTIENFKTGVAFQ